MVQVRDLQPVKNPIVYDYEKQTEQHTCVLVVGYQKPFAKHFTLDVFGGIQVGTAKLKSVHYLNPSANETGFVSYFGEHQNPIHPEFSWYVLKASVGYMF